MQRIEALHFDITSNYHDWIRIGYAIATEYGEAGRELFHRFSQFYPRYSAQQTDKVYSYILQSNRGTVRLATIFQIAKEYGIYFKQTLNA